MPDQKITAVIGRVEKSFDKRFLRLLVKIDHHISAEDNVEFQAELDRIHQVKCPEDDIVPQLLRNMVRTGSVSGTEVLLLPGRG